MERRFGTSDCKGVGLESRALIPKLKERTMSDGCSCCSLARLSVQLDAKTMLEKFAVLMNGISKTPGVSQGIITKEGGPNLVPTDMNGETRACNAFHDPPHSRLLQGG